MRLRPMSSVEISDFLSIDPLGALIKQEKVETHNLDKLNKKRFTAFRFLRPILDHPEIISALSIERKASFSESDKFPEGSSVPPSFAAAQGMDSEDTEAI